MPKCVLLILFSFSTNLGITQNLVENPGFEEYWKLPGANELVDTFFAKNWSHIYASMPSSVDYYLRNNVIIYPNHRSDSRYNVPDNHLGFHESNEGDAYVGLIPFSIHGQMEHISGKLIDTLIAGSEYEVSIFIKYSGASSMIFSSKLEIAFSSDSNFFRLKGHPKHFDYVNTSVSCYKNIFNEKKITADVTFDNIPMISDSSTWTKLKGIYKARGGEKFLTIGLFYQGEKPSEKIDNLTNKVNRPNVDWYKISMKVGNYKIPFLKSNPKYNPVYDSYAPGACYYFIDDVSVVLKSDK